MKFNRVVREKFTIKNLVFLMLFSLFLGFVNASILKVKAPSNIYRGCVQPYVVQLDSNGISTKSMDTRLFLSGYFSISSPYSTISEAMSDGSIYADYIPGGEFQVTAINTGVASSGDSYQGREYLYLNSYQLGVITTVVSGNDLSIATLYLKANNFNTGHIDFYYVTGWNGDDSNVSSGIHEANALGTYTLYEDSLTGVTNLEQIIETTAVCDSKPYIDQAVYRQTGYISVPGSAAVQAVWTSVVAGPNYITPANWTVWTKGDVELALTGISDSYADMGGLVYDGLSEGIQLNNVLLLNNQYISPINFVTTQTGWANQYYEMLITGNFEGDFEGFENILSNTGSTYNTGGNKYNEDFYVDVFWIDTVAPNADVDFTGFLLNTGVGYTTIRLSGTNYDDTASSSADGWHADWTEMDDQYKVISFSGTNSVTQDCTNLGYPCTNVGYMDYMNNTGYVVSGNNDFQLVHDIVFTTSFSGYINIIDRAGNTGQIPVEVNMDDLLEIKYGLIAYPEAGVERNELIQLSGMMMKLAIYSGDFNKDYLLGDGASELVYTGWIKTSITGYATFTGNFPAADYWVLAEGVNSLSYIMSGVNLSPAGGTIDYTSLYTGGFMFGDLYNVVSTLGSKHASYLSDGASRDNIINVNDLAIVVAIWGEYGTMNTNSKIGVYSGEFFVDKPFSGTGSKIESSLLQQNFYTESYMQHHPYDINANGIVDVGDYALINKNYGKVGHTNDGKLDGTSPATMPF